MQPVQPGELRREQNQPPNHMMRESQQNHRVSSVPMLYVNTDCSGKIENEMIDLNAQPQRIHGQASNNQVVVSPISFCVLFTGIPFG